MAIQCITCANLGLREYPRHANEGLGRCKREPKLGVFVTLLYRRECGIYQRANEEKIIQRMAWQDQLNLFRRGSNESATSTTRPPQGPRSKPTGDGSSKGRAKQGTKGSRGIQADQASPLGLEA